MDNLITQLWVLLLPPHHYHPHCHRHTRRIQSYNNVVRSIVYAEYDCYIILSLPCTIQYGIISCRLFGYTAVIFNHPIYTNHMNALSKREFFACFLRLSMLLRLICSAAVAMNIIDIQFSN